MVTILRWKANLYAPKLLSKTASLCCECVPELPQFAMIISRTLQMILRRIISQSIYFSHSNYSKTYPIKTNLKESLNKVNTRLMNGMNLVISDAYSAVSDRIERISNEFEAFLYDPRNPHQHE